MDKPTHLGRDKPRRCAGTNSRGEPCGAPRMRRSEFCSAHAGIGLQNLDAKKGAEASARVRRAKAERRQMKAIDWIAVKLEEEAEEIVNAVVEQAKAGDWRAGAWLFDRVYGKPQEHVELETKEKDWYDMTPAELDAALAKFLREHGEAAEGAGEA